MEAVAINEFKHLIVINFITIWDKDWKFSFVENHDQALIMVFGQNEQFAFSNRTKSKDVTKSKWSGNCGFIYIQT